MLTNDQTERISGLSRSQIATLISRWHVGMFGPNRPGSPRRFYPADAFVFAVAGELHRMGVPPAGQRDVIALIGPVKLDPSGAPVETFPGQAATANELFVVTELDTPDPQAFWTTQDGLGRRIRAQKCTSAIIIDAKAIAAMIEAADQ